MASSFQREVVGESSTAGPLPVTELGLIRGIAICGAQPLTRTKAMSVNLSFGSMG